MPETTTIPAAEPEGYADPQEFSADAWPTLEADVLTGDLVLDPTALHTTRKAAGTPTPATVQVGMARFIPAAANSYARMLRAGMPQTGYNNSLRTFEQQVALWKAYKAGRGNLAANPYETTSNHQRGTAMDVNTGSAMQKWLVKYGAAHGWIRDVAGEPWHFHYIASRDRHAGATSSTLDLQKALNKAGASPNLVEDGRYGTATYRALLTFQKARSLVADAIDGPKTWAALRGTVVTPPKPPAPAKAEVLARVATLNCAGWSKPERKWSTLDRLALIAVVALLKVSILLLTECPEYMRNAIRDALPGGRARWLVYVRGDQAILFDSKKWNHGGAEPLRFGPTSYHGALWATLKSVATGVAISLAAYHLPPNSVASDKYQIDALADLVDEMPKSGPRLIGGDGADEGSWVKGWGDARVVAKDSANRNAPTYQRKHIRDRIHVAGDMEVRRYTVVPATVTVKGKKVTPTDHDPVLAQITARATVTTTN